MGTERNVERSGASAWENGRMGSLWDLGGCSPSVRRVLVMSAEMETQHQHSEQPGEWGLQIMSSLESA